ncbi:DUF6368 family protein [Streptomyces sp. NPDC088812]|uniref:DUF6368 family protein n=1 Tax=Streptomyces sp. NPDC088812 TaxID=3365905 RepID=UPI0038085E7A
MAGSSPLRRRGHGCSGHGRRGRRTTGRTTGARPIGVRDPVPARPGSRSCRRPRSRPPTSPGCPVRSLSRAGTRSDQELLIGFTPTHGVDVIAFCNSPVDHAVTALSTAAVMELIGGVASAELREDQVPVVAGLPGIVTTTTDPWPAVYGSAEFRKSPAGEVGIETLTGLREDTPSRGASPARPSR